LSCALFNYTQNWLLILAYYLNGFFWLNCAQLGLNVALLYLPILLYFRQKQEEQEGEYEMLS